MRQTEILEALRSIGRPASAREIVERAGVSFDHNAQSKANRTLVSLSKYGLVRKCGELPKDRGNIAYLWEAVE